MKQFEINSDRGRVGPVVWYNQLQHGLYDYVEQEDGRLVIGKKVGVREGCGMCYLWDWCVDLHPISIHSDLHHLWNRVTGRAGPIDYIDELVEWDPGLGSYVDGYRDDEDD